jgi:TrpR-related protein YerC/YecD
MKTDTRHTHVPTDTEALCDAFLALETRDECWAFLQDLCTPAEVEAFADRWKVARALAQGLSQRAAQEKTGVSIATVTRVARFLNGTFGGYKAVLKRLGMA